MNILTLISVLFQILILIKINECTSSNEVESMKRQMKQLQANFIEIGLSFKEKMNALDRKIENSIEIFTNF